MKASRHGQPARATVSAGQSARWVSESPTADISSRRSKRSNPAASASTVKGKKSSGPSTSSTKAHQRSCTKVQVTAGENLMAYSATAISDVNPYPSDYDLAAKNFPFLAECPWPNWPDWGTEKEQGDVGCPTDSAAYFDSSSTSSSHSDSESDPLWSNTSSSSGSRLHEPSQFRKLLSYWEELIWGEPRIWTKLHHRRSFFANFWGFKSETKVEENRDPILVCVNVMGSSGPLRLIVNRNDSVQHTIDFALRRYTEQKRLPKLVGPSLLFGLYCRNPDFEALEDCERIGYRSTRQFHLYHKQRILLSKEDMDVDEAASYKSSGMTTSSGIKNRIRSNLNGMRSWAGSMVASISLTITYWVKKLNLRRFHRYAYIILSMGMT